MKPPWATAHWCPQVLARPALHGPQIWLFTYSVLSPPPQSRAAGTFPGLGLPTTIHACLPHSPPFSRESLQGPGLSRKVSDEDLYRAPRPTCTWPRSYLGTSPWKESPRDHSAHPSAPWWLREAGHLSPPSTWVPECWPWLGRWFSPERSVPWGADRMGAGQLDCMGASRSHLAENAGVRRQPSCVPPLGVTWS